MKQLSQYTTDILHQYASDERILEMKKYRQHGTISTYEHCLHVAVMSCHIAEFLSLSKHTKHNIIVGAMLHDYFLYDWHGKRMRKEGIHCWSHPETALRNASKDFNLTKRQKNIIRSHMFPSTLFHMPTNTAAWIVCITDKICAITEYADISKKERLVI